ncbi:MAG TPA: hypothetical protein VHD56_16250 [Tepidisphaeraceae bacterium]|nr:hypothetical protein [Tepidisphaeraceae bacterium]
MSRNFYFGADATMVRGSAVFSSVISADPASFGLTSAQSDAFESINAALQDAYQIAITPATRTSVAVSKKNAAVKAMQRKAVMLAKLISSTPSVNDAQLISLGLLPRAKRTRRNVPTDPPLVQVLSVVGRLVKFRVCDKDSQTGRSKPFGACGAQIFSYVGEEPANDSRAFHFECFTSRTTVQLHFPNNVPSGATVWLSARWVNARGETSIASPPLNFTLQGGPVVAETPMLAMAA